MRRIFIAACCCAGLSCGAGLAPGQSPDTNQPVAGAVQDTRSYPIEFALTPTPAAPLGANGRAEIASHNSETNAHSSVSLELKGLRPGMYSILAVKAGQQDPVKLGSFLVGNPGAGPEKVAGEDHQEVSNSSQVEELKSHTELQLPPGLVPKQINRISITDRSGTTLLTATTGTTPR